MNTDSQTKQQKPVIYMWHDRVLYIGPLPPNVSHKIAISTLSIDLYQNYQVSTDGQTWTNCRSVFWPANLVHESIYKNDLMVFFLVEPINNLCAQIQNSMTHTHADFHYQLNNEKEAIKNFLSIFHQRPKIEAVEKLIEETFSHQDTCTNRYVTHDTRIKETIESIKQNPTSKQTIETLAEQVNLSKVHLMQLFKKETGMPIGKFQMWRKIMVTTRNVLQGQSITDGAYSAGFADAAHFSRSFKDMVGICPSDFFSHPEYIDCFFSTQNIHS